MEDKILKGFVQSITVSKNLGQVGYITEHMFDDSTGQMRYLVSTGLPKPDDIVGYAESDLIVRDDLNKYVVDMIDKFSTTKELFKLTGIGKNPEETHEIYELTIRNNLLKMNNKEFKAKSYVKCKMVLPNLTIAKSVSNAMKTGDGLQGIIQECVSNNWITFEPLTEEDYKSESEVSSDE